MAQFCSTYGHLSFHCTQHASPHLADVTKVANTQGLWIALPFKMNGNSHAHQK